MNFFINQGRCRICGKMFCCKDHQKEHESIQHKEYAYILEKLPLLCKKCHRVIYFIYDLHLGCHPFMNPHLMNGNFHDSVVSYAKSNRKRSLKDTEENNPAKNYLTLPEKHRKKLTPVYKFKPLDLKNFIATADSSQMLIIEFNQIIMDSKSVFSPQLNITYKMLADSVLKSSTPLNEPEKDDPPAIPNELQSEKSVYCTPEMVQSSILIISTKKNTPPGIMSNFSKRSSKSIVKNRKVTFEVMKSPEIDDNVSVYGTPRATMEILDEFEENDDIAVKPANIPNSPPGCFLVKIVKRVKTVIHQIPKSIYTAWGWSGQKFKKSNSTENEINGEIRSPLRKRIKYDSDDFLSRRPISSYWVNMSVNSMFRKPLPNYVQRYYDSVENHYQ